MTYDLVDLYFEMGEKLPGELARIAFGQLSTEPHRLDGRCAELVLRIVESWKVRFPVSRRVLLRLLTSVTSTCGVRMLHMDELNSPKAPCLWFS